jgi:hypothetical protein
MRIYNSLGKKPKWRVYCYDQEQKRIRTGDFASIGQINREWDMNLTYDIVRRIRTGFRVDEKMRNKENSFLSRWGHIKIEKV